jgi:DNA-binding CsgD family transcriptional regulator
MELLIIAAFLFCAAFAAAGILLVRNLMNTYDVQYLRSLLYYNIFIFAFGTYGVWGQFVIAFIASPDLSAEAVSAISRISLLFGLPFLVFAWLMILRFSAGVAGRCFSGLFSTLFLIINFGIIILLGVLTQEKNSSSTLSFFKYFYCGAGLIYFTMSSIVIFSSSRNIPPLNINDRIKIAAIYIAGIISQVLSIILIKEDIVMALAFAFLLFGSTAAIPVFLNYFVVFRINQKSVSPVKENIKDFFGRYEISAREADIVKEICQGLSNQEIADKLFISLQTVKDHTHRIYIKTNVRNRMQLMNKVAEFRVESQKSKVES